MQMQQLIDQLCATYVERSETIEPLVAAVITRRHAVLIGPPGTAKSSLVRDLAAGLGGLRFFSWLLTEFSVPEELFGPLDISALEQGQYRRLTTSKLPEAELAFIDEVFKAGPAILNTLLSVMQERLFYNDGQPTPVPLVSLIGASNETPTGEQELEALRLRSGQALWDRFTVRLQVGYIQEPGNFVQMLTGSTGNVAQALSRADPSTRLPSASLGTGRTGPIWRHAGCPGDATASRSRGQPEGSPEEAGGAGGTGLWPAKGGGCA